MGPGTGGAVRSLALDTTTLSTTTVALRSKHSNFETKITTTRASSFVTGGGPLRAATSSTLSGPRRSCRAMARAGGDVLASAGWYCVLAAGALSFAPGTGPLRAAPSSHPTAGDSDGGFLAS